MQKAKVWKDKGNGYVPEYRGKVQKIGNGSIVMMRTRGLLC